MNLLALDTSTLSAALAVQRSDGAVFVAHPDPTSRHGRSLVPAIRDLVREAGLALRQIDAIAVGLGPGSYTGLRIGLTAAKTLAYALDRPLAGFDSLELLAQNAPAEVLRIAVIADAQRGDLYAASFHRAAPGAAIERGGPTQLEPAADWLSRLQPGTFVLGPGLERLQDSLPPRLTAGPTELARPLGEHLVPLARATLARGKVEDPWLLEPLYIRRSAAEDQWEARRHELKPSPRS